MVVGRGYESWVVGVGSRGCGYKVVGDYNELIN